MVPFEWHSLQVDRRLRDAKMILDGKDVVRGRAPGSTRGLNIRMHVYFGGFDGEAEERKEGVRNPRILSFRILQAARST